MNVQRVFGCGIDGRAFKAKYEGLSDEDQFRLSRVAGRVLLTLKLRYEVAFHSNPFAWRGEESGLRHVALPSTEVYLLCTCLDTLAGKAVHKSFPDWTKEQPTTMDWWKDTETVWSRYQDEYGVGRNLEALYGALPQSAKDWLVSNVAIRRADQPLAPEQQDVGKLLKRLYRYFYNIRRNAYTHSSVSHPTHVADDIREPTDGEWWVAPVLAAQFVFDRKKPKQKWNLSYRQGLDEATILRIIINAIALDMLGIELIMSHNVV